MLKILHLSDLHLDSPMKKMPYRNAAAFRTKLRAAFSDALGFAQKEACSAVLISGDLFDTEFYQRDTVDFLCGQFASYPSIRFIIAPGNHDPHTPSSPYAVTKFPENVYLFSAEEISSFHFPEIELTVYGYAFTSHSYHGRPISGFSANRDGFKILCAHADTDNSLSVYAPISASELESSGLDYAALGHIHTKPEILKSGNTVYAYSGCIAGRDFTEFGEKGGILVTLDRLNEAKTVKAERIRFCPWRYETIELDITGVPENELIAFTQKHIERFLSEAPNDEFILKTELTGYIPYQPSCDELRSALSETSQVSFIDKTNFIPPSGLENDYTVRGEFYRLLKPKLESPDPEERSMAALAFRLGISALESKNL